MRPNIHSVRFDPTIRDTPRFSVLAWHAPHILRWQVSRSLGWHVEIFRGAKMTPKDPGQAIMQAKALRRYAKT